MDEQTLQQIQQLVAAAMQGNQEALNAIQQVQQEAQKGNQQAIQLMKVIQEIAQQMQGQQSQQVQSAKTGAKINYIKQLRGKCPEGYNLEYYKSGGCLCKKCVAKKKSMQDGGEVLDNPVDNFKAEYAKKGKKMCKDSKFKMQRGGELTEDEKSAKKEAEKYNVRGDIASADSIYANKLNDQDVLTNHSGKHPGFIQKGKWVPDRNKYKELYPSK